MKRLIVFFVVITLLAGNGTLAYAAGADNPAVSQKKIMVYVKPDVTVKLNGVKQCFRNSQGHDVYPVIYNGCTYLPIRASSALMKEPIEWDKASKTVFIGKTISNPNKSTLSISTEAAVAVSDSAIIATKNPTLESAYLKPDILVMFDFEIQNFQDANGAAVYPIVYNGSTYLPIRAISNLMNVSVEWDGQSKTISIGEEDIYAVIEEEQMAKEDEKQTKPPVVVITSAILLKDLFERVEVLYYEATAKTTAINEAASLEEKLLIAASVTENYQKVQAMTMEIKAVDQVAFTAEEKAVLEKLKAYSESTEYYILVLENIAYLAAQNNDYSMLAETFLYFAMDSQSKMEEARTAVQALK